MAGGHFSASTTYDRNGRIEFEGDLDNNLTGTGKIYSDGKLRFEGNFQEGAAHGYGCAYNTSGNPIYRGTWTGGKRNGYGESFFYSGIEGQQTTQRVKLYAGYWKNGRFHGPGKVYAGDTIEESRLWKDGEFKEGQLVKGDMYFTDENTGDQLIYRGEFEYEKYACEGEFFEYHLGECIKRKTGTWWKVRFLTGSIYDVVTGESEQYINGIKM